VIIELYQMAQCVCFIEKMIIEKSISIPTEILIGRLVIKTSIRGEFQTCRLFDKICQTEHFTGDSDSDSDSDSEHLLMTIYKENIAMGIIQFMELLYVQFGI